MRQAAQHLAQRSCALANLRQGTLHFGYLNLAKTREGVLLGGEVVEERPLAHVGGLRDLFDGSGKEALASKEVEGGTQNASAGFGLAAGTAAGAGRGARQAAEG